MKHYQVFDQGHRQVVWNLCADEVDIGPVLIFKLNGIVAGVFQEKCWGMFFYTDKPIKTPQMPV